MIYIKTINFIMFSTFSYIVLSNLFANATITGSTDIYLFKNNVINEFTDLIFKVNEANRKINDYCDIIDIDEGILINEVKPKCNTEFSYLDSNYTIHLFKNKDNVRDFFDKKRTEYCKQENILCGELTILIKMFDLINGLTDIMMKTSHTYETFMFNINVIDFKNLYNLYMSSLDNTDLLINITLRRQHANVILEKERTRISKLMNQAYYERFADKVSLYVGSPLFNSVKYIGSSAGSIISDTINSVMPDLSFEAKIIILVMLLIILKKS